jgi:hypothetical protein
MDAKHTITQSMQPIIIVRYFPGTGGRFLCTLLSSLVEPVELVESHRAHLNSDWNRHHNYDQKDSPTDQYDQYNGMNQLHPSDDHIQAGADFFRNTIKFGKEFNGMPEPDMFILSGHIYNPESLLRAWPSSRVINITFNAQDLDQISYNWVTKNIIQESRYEDLRTLVNLLHREWPRHLGTIKMEDVQWGDVRNMSFITRWLNNQTSKRFSSISTAMASQSNVLNINFSDIYSGKIITQLNDIIEFCEITVSAQRRDNAVRLIQQYSSAQTPVPWSLDDDITPSP